MKVIPPNLAVTPPPPETTKPVVAEPEAVVTPIEALAEKNLKRSIVPHLPKLVTKPRVFKRPSREYFRIESFPGKGPKVIIKKDAFLKMKALIAECSIEVSWMATCDMMDDGNFVIEDVFVPEQECSGTTTDMTIDGVALLINEMLETGRHKEINKLKCWGHSHVNMGVSPSGVDENQTDEFIERLDSFFIRVIGNKRADMSCHVYILGKGGVVRQILHHPDIEVEGAPYENNEFTEWAKTEIDKKVKKRVWSWGGRKTTVITPKDGPSEESIDDIIDAILEEPAETVEEPIVDAKPETVKSTNGEVKDDKA